MAGDSWSEKNDVFAFGVILLELIAKRVFDLEEARKNIVFTLCARMGQEGVQSKEVNYGIWPAEAFTCAPKF